MMRMCGLEHLAKCGRFLAQPWCQMRSLETKREKASNWEIKLEANARLLRNPSNCQILWFASHLAMFLQVFWQLSYHQEGVDEKGLNLKATVESEMEAQISPSCQILWLDSFSHICDRNQCCCFFGMICWNLPPLALLNWFSFILGWWPLTRLERMGQLWWCSCERADDSGRGRGQMTVVVGDAGSYQTSIVVMLLPAAVRDHFARASTSEQ